jgi:glycosyltransferase involved in cell wall biosynthesis
VRQLAADPKLGLAGPVTNAIANAAKIDVGYASVADLPAWAAGWVRAHDREAFEIPMLALFCTAMPRRVWEEVGPLDERFGIGLFEDDDYNRRVRGKGYAVRCARDAFVHHWQLASFRKMSKEAYFALYAENKRKYDEKERAPAAPPRPPRRPRARAPLRDPRGAPRSAFARARARAGEQGRRGLSAVRRLGHPPLSAPAPPRPRIRALGYVAIFDSSNAADRVDGFREIEPNLFLFSGSPALLHEVPSPLLWAFPYNFHLADGYPKPARTVYDWIDDLSVFPYDEALLQNNHARGLAEATVVASVARTLHEQALKQRPDAILLPNGVEYERFAAPAAPPRDEELLRFLAPGAPVAGYYGALAEWFDYALLDAVAASRPDWRFVLIGPQYDKSLPGQPMLKRENVRWLGARDYVTLPGYLSLFDVATIPFRINAITQATSPLKLYEYFAGGKPVVTTPMLECRAYPEVRIAATAAEFASALDAARDQGRDADFRARLRALGRENSWSARHDRAARARRRARPLGRDAVARKRRASGDAPHESESDGSEARLDRDGPGRR